MKKLLFLLPLLLFLGADEGTKINRVLLTRYGGVAILLQANEALSAGELVEIPQTAGNGLVAKAQVDSDMPIGVVYEAAGDKAPVWIVVAGVAYTLPNAADTPAAGYVIYSSSTTTGRVSQSSTLPAVTLHNREVGHWLDNCAQGVICKAVLHWN